MKKCTIVTAICVSGLFLFSGLFVTACLEKAPSSVPGRMVFFDRTLEEFDFDTDQCDSVRDFDGLGGQEFLSTGPDDSILIQMEYPGQDVTFHRSVFIQSIRSLANEWKVKFPYPTFKCYNLEFDRETDHYLFSGKIHDTLGIFELDRDLNVLRMRTISNICGKDQYSVAYYLRGDSLLVQCGSNILIGSWHSERLNFVCDGLILAVSSDRNHALLRSSGDDPATLSEVVCATGIVNRLPIDCFAVLHASYSPDGRYIAYNERLNRLVLTINVRVYDRFEEKTWKTDLYNDASFVWLGSK